MGTDQSLMISNEANGAKAGRRPFYIVLAVIVVIGVFLRFYQINNQVIGDDEWHGINVASIHSYSAIVSSFHESDNCIPLTLFYRLLMDTVGIDELNFHIIQLLFGVLAVLVLPMIVLKIVGARTSLIFGFLLSISPQLIYYSRYARPYAVTAFLGTASIFCFYFWIKSGRKSFAAYYVIGTIVSAYFSILSIPFLVFPLFVSFIYYLMNRTKGGSQISVLSIVVIGLAVAAGIVASYLPALDSLDKIVTKKGEGYLEVGTLTGFVNLFSGSYMPFITALIAIIAITGLVRSFRRNRLFTSLVFLTCLFQFLFVIVLMPFKIELAYVMARYNIAALLFYLLFAAIGIDALCFKIVGSLIDNHAVKRIFQTVLLAVVILVIVYANPLTLIYGTQNNFTNHNDYQCDFSSIIYAAEEPDTFLYSPFYQKLEMEEDSTIIVEFPYLLWWDSNFFHLYQRFHKKKVRIGHIDETYITPPMVKCKNIRFNSFVKFSKLKELKESGAKYLIIHKDVAKEMVKARYIYEYNKDIEDEDLKNMSGEFEIFYIDMSRKIAGVMINETAKKLGPPIFNDKWITVFRVPE